MNAGNKEKNCVVKVWISELAEPAFNSDVLKVLSSVYAQMSMSVQAPTLKT